MKTVYLPASLNVMKYRQVTIPRCLDPKQARVTLDLTEHIDKREEREHHKMVLEEARESIEMIKELHKPQEPIEESFDGRKFTLVYRNKLGEQNKKGDRK